LRPGLSLMELVSDGTMTLMRAIESFDTHGRHAAAKVFVTHDGQLLESPAEPTSAWKPIAVYPREAHVDVFLRQTLLAQNSLLRLYRTANSRLAADVADSCQFNDTQIAEINRRIRA